MTKRLCRAVCLVVPLTVLLGAAPARAAGKKYALLVGINAYDSDKLPRLEYAVRDAARTAAVLKKHGYDVTLLTDEAGRADQSRLPTRDNIERALDGLLGRYDPERKRTDGGRFRRGDTLLVGFAGHGVQFGADAFLCPQDAIPTEKQAGTLIAVKEVYARLEGAPRGVKLMLIDACRDDGGRGTRGVDGDSAPAPPRGVGVLFSCSAGEKANEHQDLKHGVFFYHVIRGLEGAAGEKESAEVTWDSLRSYVKRRVPAQVVQLYGRTDDGEPNRRQSPNELGNLSGVPPVLLHLDRTGPAPAPQLRVRAASPAQRKRAVSFIKSVGGKYKTNRRQPGKPLTEIDLYGKKTVRDAHLAYFKPLTGLRKLILSETQVGDRGKEYLRNLKELRVLYLYYTNVSDTGMETLRGLTKLEELALSSTDITDAALPYLRGMENLKVLWLFATPITDDGMEEFRHLRKLKELNLQRTKITSAGLRYLEPLTALERLYLDDTAVTNSGLRHLEGLTRLKELTLMRTRITAQGLRRLRQALPETEIKAKPRKPATKGKNKALRSKD
jgi:hypothetical protein